jgi:type II secretory pathway component HofQ
LLLSLKNAGAAGSNGINSSGGFLSNRGRVTFDERTNSLLIDDTPDRIKMIRGIVATLDRPVQQVLIESRVVVANDNFAREIGAKFGISGGFQSNNTVVVDRRQARGDRRDVERRPEQSLRGHWQRSAKHGARHGGRGHSCSVAGRSP